MLILIFVSDEFLPNDKLQVFFIHHFIFYFERLSNHFSLPIRKDD
jgi:hypothetical protein